MSAVIVRTMAAPPKPWRHWTPDRAVRLAAGVGVWFLFRPGELARCPKCADGLSEFGAALGVVVRIHPEQRRTGLRYAGPTGDSGESRRCERCGTHLDLRFLPVTRTIQP